MRGELRELHVLAAGGVHHGGTDAERCDVRLEEVEQGAGHGGRDDERAGGGVPCERTDFLGAGTLAQQLALLHGALDVDLELTAQVLGGQCPGAEGVDTGGVVACGAGLTEDRKGLGAELCGFLLAGLAGDELADLGVNAVDLGVHAGDLGGFFGGTLTAGSGVKLSTELLDDTGTVLVERDDMGTDVHGSRPFGSVVGVGVARGGLRVVALRAPSRGSE